MSGAKPVGIFGGGWTGKGLEGSGYWGWGTPSRSSGWGAGGAGGGADADTAAELEWAGSACGGAAEERVGASVSSSGPSIVIGGGEEPIAGVRFPSDNAK